MKAALFLVLILGSSPLGKADQLFVTPAGSLSGGDPVSAMADFSFSGSQLTLTLSNTQTGIKDAGQLVTDVFFTLSEPGTPTLSSEMGNLVMVTEDEKTKVQTVSNLGPSTLGWAFGAVTLGSTSGLELCVICQGGLTTTVTPAQGILGPASADGLYDNAKGSIAENPKNPSHNPFVNDMATFVLTGIPVGAVVDGVTFSFSTTAGDNIAGVPGSVVPEPATVFLMGTALLALARLGSRWKSPKAGA